MLQLRNIIVNIFHVTKMLALLFRLCYSTMGCIFYATRIGGESIRLAELRKAKGFSQEKLAALSGVSRVTIARLETGKTSTTLQTLERIAAALGVTVSVLLEKAG